MKRKEIKVKGFARRDGLLWGEDVDLRTITGKIGTPCFIYSRPVLLANVHRFQEAFTGMNALICFAVKANRSLAILQTLAQQGLGFDLVSGGELEAVLRAGGCPQRLIYSGVGKTRDELYRALSRGIFQFNVESKEELEGIRQCAKELGCCAPVALRVNPDVEAATHPYIGTGSAQHKFGIDLAEIPSLLETFRGWKEIRFQGLACHIGSQICSLRPFHRAFSRMAQLVRDLRTAGVRVKTIDLGGGLGVRYHREKPLCLKKYAELIRKYFAPFDAMILMEPGRRLMEDAGILVTRLLYRKETRGKQFYIVDAGMNDLIRPTLYQAWHPILPINLSAKRKVRKTDVVGPLCETGDFLAKNRLLPEMEPGEELAILQAAAYGYAQSSNYNARCRAAEIMITGKTWVEIRRRETLDDLFRTEVLLP